MPLSYVEKLQKRISVGRGEIPGDWVLKNCRFVNVYTQTICRGDIVGADGYIAGIGGPYEGKKEWDAGAYIAAPGLIDSHIHVESSYTSPEEFARMVVPYGTTAVVADPHEIVNVCGLAGLQYMQQASRLTPLHIAWMLPSCVPATPFDHSGAGLTAADMERPLRQHNVSGLGEFMNFPGVLAGNKDVLQKLAQAFDSGKPVDGHSPGLQGADLQAYIGAGIQTDHECHTAAEAQERVAAGMYVLLRYGSACHDLPRLIQAVTPATLRRFLLCSDDLHPRTIRERGHLNESLRLCVAAGLSPEAALTMATLNAAECYGFHDRGALAPGKRADIVLFDDLANFHVAKTLIGGEEAAVNGACLWPVIRQPYTEVSSSVQVGDLSPERFALQVKSSLVHTIDIQPGSVVTRKGRATIQRDGQGDFIYNPQEDIVKVAVVERHRGTGHMGLGLLRGYGLKKGAVAVSIAHDSHNIIVAGTNNTDMDTAVRALIKSRGGMTAVCDGQVVCTIPLPIAGLMSDHSGDWVAARMEEFYAVGREWGIPDTVDMVMTLCFMSLPVIPEIKLMDTGLFDVEKFRFLSLEAE